MRSMVTVCLLPCVQTFAEDAACVEDVTKTPLYLCWLCWHVLDTATRAIRVHYHVVYGMIMHKIKKALW